MRFADDLYGYGQAAAPRQIATAALLDAVQAITALDSRLHQHPLAPALARVERELAVAAAAAEAEPGSIDVELILRARLGVMWLPAGHIALSDLDDRARAWAMVRQRKGNAELRTLVGALTLPRGSRDLVGLADKVTATLARVSTASWELTQQGQGARTLTAAREALVEVETLRWGKITMQNSFPKLSATPSLIRSPAPTIVGEHNAEIYGALLGLGSDALATLAATGVI